MTAEFPEKITTQLKTAVNNLLMTLTDDVGENDDEIFVQATAGAPDSGSFHIENEIIFYPTKTSLKFGPGLTRGADGTTKAVHTKTAEGGEIKFGPEAHFINTPNDEIIATQTKVGKDSDTNTDSHDYKLRNLPYGKNLILNGAFIDSDGDNLPDFWGLQNTPTLAIAPDTLFPARKGNQITMTATGGASEGIQIVPGTANWLKVLSSTKYTFSIDYKVTAGDLFTIQISSYNGAVAGTAHIGVNLSSATEVRVSYSFITDADADNLFIGLYAANDTDIVTISHLKLEQGAIATPYIEDNADLVDGVHGSNIVIGWIPAGTFTYASPTTITVASGAASIYQIGDKIKLTQTTAKYFYISAVADTLLTVNGAGLYTVADAAITLPYYSHSANPLGFPIKMIPGYVKASAYLGTDMANIVNATFTKVTLDTENYDIGSDFASNKFIAPVSGYYRISGTIAYASTNVADGKRFFAVIYKNNASYRSVMSHSSAATVSLVPNISFEMYLAKTDYIELYCYHTNATNTITVSGTLETSLDISLISII